MTRVFTCQLQHIVCGGGVYFQVVCSCVTLQKLSSMVVDAKQSTKGSGFGREGGREGDSCSGLAIETNIHIVDSSEAAKAPHSCCKCAIPPHACRLQDEIWDEAELRRISNTVCAADQPVVILRSSTDLLQARRGPFTTFKNNHEYDCMCSWVMKCSHTHYFFYKQNFSGRTFQAPST